MHVDSLDSNPVPEHHRCGPQHVKPNPIKEGWSLHPKGSLNLSHLFGGASCPHAHFPGVRGSITQQTCLRASSMAFSSCLTSDPHSLVFSSSRSWDWWIASSLLAITWRNSRFWALVASSFLGESTQVRVEGTSIYPVLPRQGGRSAGQP